MPKALKVNDPVSQKSWSSNELHFEVKIGADKNRNPFVQVLQYQLGSVDLSIAIGMSRKADGTKYDLTTQGYHPVRQKGRGWPLPAPVHFYGFPDEAVVYYQNTGFVSDLNLEMSRFLKRIHYVGPLREYPKRLYQWSGEVPENIGLKGERAIEAILASRGRKFNFAAKQKTRSLDEIIAERLKKMGLIHDFSVKAVANGRKEYEVLVRTGKRRPDVLLTDVGIGVSQVLPVVVESLYVPSHSIVILEQPEIHLHPSAQAELADLFIDSIHARERGHARNVQFIIESHSEHFLRRLQRRIAEERLEQKDVALYFVHIDDEAARLEELEVDLFGRIKNWPEHFFGDAIGETESQIRSMIERTQKRSAENILG